MVFFVRVLSLLEEDDVCVFPFFSHISAYPPIVDISINIMTKNFFILL